MAGGRRSEGRAAWRGAACRLQEQLRVAVGAHHECESRLATTEAALEVTRREAEARASTIRWLESQVGLEGGGGRGGSALSKRSGTLG